MAYEWDSAKVRKSYRIKMAVACLAALIMAAVPLGLIFISLD